MRITDVQLTPVCTRRETGTLTPHVIVQLPTDEGLVGLGEMSNLTLPCPRSDISPRPTRPSSVGSCTMT